MTEQKYTYCGSCGARNDQEHYKECVLNKEMTIFQMFRLHEALYHKMQVEIRNLTPKDLEMAIHVIEEYQERIQ